MLLNIIPFAHDLLSKVIQPGDTVIDATMGNGLDSVFLAKAVEESGKVISFDIQKQGLENTQILLNKLEIKQVQLVLDSHEHFNKYTTEPLTAGIFNLGYLPGGNKQIVTQAEVVIKTLALLLPVLKPTGIIAIILYPGHLTGRDEQIQIETYLQSLNQQQFNVLRYGFSNRPAIAPYGLFVEKLKNV